jgi:chromosome segregation ATPase
MDGDFVTYEQSIFLRELGFDRPCLGYFFKDKFYPCDTFDVGEGGGFVPFDTELNMGNENIVARPLYQQAFKWINDELRKFKNDFNVSSSKFYVNFESPQDSLDKLIDLLIKIKKSEELEEEDRDLIITTNTIEDKSTIEDFTSKVQIINELKERARRYQDENISLRAKIRSYAKNNNELKTQKDKKQNESEYLNDEVVNLISKNRKNVLEIEKLKNSVVSLSKIKDRLELDIHIKSNSITNLEEIIDTLYSKIKLLESKIQNNENIITENYRKFADSLVEEAKKTKKFLYFFTINNKEMDKFIQLASKYYEFAIERGCEESKIKLEELKVDKKFSKYF